MHDDSVLVAIDEALSSSASCGCGRSLTIDEHEGVLWLQCVAFARSLRSPRRVTAFLRSVLHDRRFVIALPPVAALTRAPMPPVSAAQATAGAGAGADAYGPPRRSLPGPLPVQPRPDLLPSVIADRIRFAGPTKEPHAELAVRGATPPRHAGF